MGDICCGARVGPAPRAIKLVEIRIIAPNQLINEQVANKVPHVVTLGVLDHVTAPQMVSLLTKIKNKVHGTDFKFSSSVS